MSGPVAAGSRLGRGLWKAAARHPERSKVGKTDGGEEAVPDQEPDGSVGAGSAVAAASPPTTSEDG